MTTADAMAAPNLTRGPLRSAQQRLALRFGLNPHATNALAGLSSNVVGGFALTALVLEL